MTQRATVSLVLPASLALPTLVYRGLSTGNVQEPLLFGLWGAFVLFLSAVLYWMFGRNSPAAWGGGEAESTGKVQSSLLGSLIGAVDARDLYTRGHSARVCHLADLIAREMGLPAQQCANIRFASLLHDVGKIGLPDAVLRKEGPLTATERSIMMEHPVRGAEMLGQATDVQEAVIRAIRHHHEWVNGGGYPDGIRGDAISIEARIIAVANAFEAMTSPRRHRPGLSWSEAANRLKQGRGTQFEPAVTDSLFRVLERSPSLQSEMDRFISRGPGHRKRIHEAERRGLVDVRMGRILPVHSKEIHLLYRLSQGRRSMLDLSHMLHRVVEVLYDAMGPALYSIMLMDEATDELVVRAAAGSRVELSGRRLPARQGWCGRVLESGVPQVVADMKQEPDCRRFDPGCGSLAMVPLLLDGKVTGVLRVEARQPEAFGQEEVYLLRAVADQVVDAIEVAAAHEQTAYAASHDGLTGALNRTAFYGKLKEELQRAREGGYPVAVAVLDLNGFKKVNDTHGHLAGDRVVSGFASYLIACMPRSDLVARYGGDEFSVILPGWDHETASHCMATVTSSAPQRSVTLGETAISLPSVAWGVATFPDDGLVVEELVARADQQMYERKKRTSSAELTVAI